MGYRKDLASSGYQYNELTDFGYDDNKETLIPESETKSIIDSIENRVNDALSILESINGLTEIDNAKEILQKLSSDLY